MRIVHLSRAVAPVHDGPLAEAVARLAQAQVRLGLEVQVVAPLPRGDRPVFERHRGVDYALLPPAQTRKPARTDETGAAGLGLDPAVLDLRRFQRLAARRAEVLSADLVHVHGVAGAAYLALRQRPAAVLTTHVAEELGPRAIRELVLAFNPLGLDLRRSVRLADTVMVESREEKRLFARLRRGRPIRVLPVRPEPVALRLAPGLAWMQLARRVLAIYGAHLGAVSGDSEARAA